jgi:hypothetical protein
MKIKWITMSIAWVEPMANDYINRVPYKGLASMLLWVVVANIDPRDVGVQIYNPRREWRILSSKGWRVSYSEVNTLFCASTFSFHQREVIFVIGDLS